MKKKMIVMTMALAVIFTGCNESGLSKPAKAESDSYLVKLDDASSNIYPDPEFTSWGMTDDEDINIQFITPRLCGKVEVQFASTPDFEFNRRSYYLSVESDSYYDYVCDLDTSGWGSLYCRMKTAITGDFGEPVQIF